MQPRISTYVWPGQVRFGFGAAGLIADDVATLAARHAFILADPGVVAAGLAGALTIPLDAAGVPYTLYDGVIPNPDTVTVDAAAAAFRQSGADLIVGLGGGSALDTAKAVRLLAGGPEGCRVIDLGPFPGRTARPAPQARDMPPLIAVPTTAGTGSEVTPFTVVTDPDAHVKIGLVSGAATMPTAALVDPEMTLSLPAAVTAGTGMDALTHAIEAFVSTNANPLLDPLLLHGIELIGRRLRTAVAQGANPGARRDVMMGSLIAGIGISSNWLGACHSLTHPLSGRAGVPHGLANAIMLPHQMAFSLPGNLERYARIAAALDAPFPVPGPLRRQAERGVAAVRELLADVGLPDRLSAVGVTADMIDDLADDAANDPNWSSNPRIPSRDDLAGIYRQAL